MKYIYLIIKIIHDDTYVPISYKIIDKATDIKSAKQKLNNHFKFSNKILFENSPCLHNAVMYNELMSDKKHLIYPMSSLLMQYKNVKPLLELYIPTLKNYIDNDELMYHQNKIKLYKCCIS